jgi:hypothetical protein
VTGALARRAYGLAAPSPLAGIRAAPQAAVPYLAALIVALAACYSPTLRDCTLQCASAHDCAGGQVCGNDGYCAAPDVAGHCVADAAASRDATRQPPDAKSCGALCTKGTCQDGTCVIDCSASSTCAGDVVCPAGIACRVVCGDQSCGHHVVCPPASPCTVDCIGDAACADVIQCGMASCNVTCSGPSSCHKPVACMNACACDVACTGAMSCPGASMCPQGPGCLYGHGCTSALPGCDRC